MSFSSSQHLTPGLAICIPSTQDEEEHLEDKMQQLDRSVRDVNKVL